jgi:hypothetical protein
MSIPLLSHPFHTKFTGFEQPEEKLAIDYG